MQTSLHVDFAMRTRGNSKGTRLLLVCLCVCPCQYRIATKTAPNCFELTGAVEVRLRCGEGGGEGISRRCAHLYIIVAGGRAGDLEARTGLLPRSTFLRLRLNLTSLRRAGGAKVAAPPRLTGSDSELFWPGCIYSVLGSDV